MLIDVHAHFYHDRTPRADWRAPAPPRVQLGERARGRGPRVWPPGGRPGGRVGRGGGARAPPGRGPPGGRHPKVSSTPPHRGGGGDGQPSPPARGGGGG